MFVKQGKCFTSYDKNSTFSSFVANYFSAKYGSHVRNSTPNKKPKPNIYSTPKSLTKKVKCVLQMDTLNAVAFLLIL